MQTDKKLFLAGALFHALVAINSEGPLGLVIAFFAATFLYLGLPNGSSVDRDAKGSNQITNEQGTVTDKEK